jgi:hypothetical protein
VREKWKNSQPQGYLFWFNILKNENENQGMVKVSKEGLKALKAKVMLLTTFNFKNKEAIGDNV